MIDELEALLRPPELPLVAYPSKMIELANGKMLVIRQACLDEADRLLEIIMPVIKLRRDFYDIVTARIYAEILAWKRHRVRNEYVLVGLVEGKLAGIANGRLVDETKGMSYHTLSLLRGVRIGAHLFAAKMEYHLEYLHQEEVYIVAESPIGHRRWMIEYPLAKKYEVQHELGGAPSWVLTRDIYFSAKPRMVCGRRPVPQDVLLSASTMGQPDLRTFLVEIDDELESRI
jgi:hypothetical protein